MEKEHGPKVLVDVIKVGRTPPNCDITLEIQPLFASQGVARGLWTISEKFLNGNGVCMGGFVSAATDTMMAYALASKVDENQMFSTIDLHTTYHRPAIIGTAEVEARVERLGAKVAYLVAEVTQQGKKVASAVSTVLVMTV